MQFTIQTDKPGKPVRNFWNHIHFHPTDAIEDDWGQRILNQVAEDRVAQTVRMYTMMEDIVSLSEDGTLQYDFSLTDTRLDYMISKGFRILLSYNFIPPCIATDPMESSAHARNKTRYKGKMIVTSPPKDYALWEEICRVYTSHIVERYGVETVKQWYLQCYNEPDHSGFFFRAETEDDKKRAQEYGKLYTAFERGVLSVCPQLQIGGPALAGKLDFFREFLRIIRDEGHRLDYVCIHTYGVDPISLDTGEKELNVCNTIRKAQMLWEIICEYGFGNVPYIIDEWGSASRGFCNMSQVPSLEFRETEVFSAYYVKMLTIYDGMKLPVDRMMICLSGQHEMETDFTGFRGFFTLNHFPKPIYNAYKLAAKLEGRKLSCSCPYVGEEYSLFPTMDSNGRICVLYAHCKDNLTPIPEEKVELTLAGTGSWRVRMWQIDAEHGNGYRAFLRMGAPDKLTPRQMEDIAAAAACEPVEIGSFAAGQTISFVAGNNSVTLLEAVPV